MQKIYVLLRQDQQTGPYSLEEIIQFDLKPYDLIWIQGSSAGWYYPQEIAALHPYLPFLPKKPQPVQEASPVFVAMPTPGQPIETPAPPPDAFSYTPHESTIKAHVSASAAALEDAIHAQFKEKPDTGSSTLASPTKKTKKPVNSAVVGLTTVLIIGGVFAASWMMNRQPTETAVTPSEVIADGSAPEEISNTAANQKDDRSTVSAPSPLSRKEKTPAISQQTGKRTTATVPVSRDVTTDTDNSTPEITPEQTIPPQQDPAVTSSSEEPESADSGNSAPQEKKKKLRDKLFDIFRKKPEASAPEESRPAENRSGERTSSRREGDTNLAQMVHVRFTVPNEWMMGIHGAKATLVNRSSETIQKATVEVQYFDDDNQLLQKKNISFDNIGGKGSKTASIPDHATATKVEYSIVSVVGKPAA